MYLYNSFGTIRLELHESDHTVDLLIKEGTGVNWKRIKKIAFYKGDNKPYIHLCGLRRCANFKPGSLPRDRNHGTFTIYTVSEMAANQPKLGVKVIESNGYTYGILVVFLGDWVEICNPAQVSITCQLTDVYDTTQ